MDEEYENYMQQFDNAEQHQSQMEVEEDEEEEDHMDEEELDGDDDVNFEENVENELGNQTQEKSESEDQMEIETEEEASNLFQSMSYGLNKQNIEKIEQKLIKPKDWYLKGEALANTRQKEQLVDQKIEFDLGMTSNIQITEEINQNFEDILKQIILDKTYDDRNVQQIKDKKINLKQQELPELDFEKNKLSLAQIEEQKYIKVNGLDTKSKTKTEIMIEQIRDLYKQFCFEIDNMSRVDMKVKKVISEKVLDKQEEWLKEDKVPVVIQTFSNVQIQDSNFRPQDQDLFTKTDMTQQEKKRLQKKIKKIRKIKGQKREKIEQEKTGLTKADTQLLKKNQSLVNKKIKDSKKSAPGLQKQSQFFSTLAKRDKQQFQQLNYKSRSNSFDNVLQYFQVSVNSLSAKLIP